MATLVFLAFIKGYYAGVFERSTGGSPLPGRSPLMLPPSTSQSGRYQETPKMVLGWGTGPVELPVVGGGPWDPMTIDPTGQSYAPLTEPTKEPVDVHFQDDEPQLLWQLVEGDRKTVGSDNEITFQFSRGEDEVRPSLTIWRSRPCCSTTAWKMIDTKSFR